MKLIIILSIIAVTSVSAQTNQTDATTSSQGNNTATNNTTEQNINGKELLFIVSHRNFRYIPANSFPFSEICNIMEEMCKIVVKFESADAVDYIDDNLENNMPDHIKGIPNLNLLKLQEVIAPILKKNEEVEESSVPEVVEAVRRYLSATLK